MLKSDSTVGKFIQSLIYSLMALKMVFEGDLDRAKTYVDSSYQVSSENRTLNQMKMVFVSSNLITMAKYHESKNEYDQAIRFLKERFNLESSIFIGTYFGYSQYKQAQLYELKGDKQKAIEYYDRFLEYFSECDPQYQHWVDDARDKRDALFKSTL